jgi:hypothetical protein
MVLAVLLVMELILHHFPHLMVEVVDLMVKLRMDRMVVYMVAAVLKDQRMIWGVRYLDEVDKLVVAVP